MSAMGDEARIGGRLITPAQCGALAFARAFPHPARPRVALSESDHVLSPGQPVEANVTGDAIRYVTPLLVDPNGAVTDLSPHMRRDGPALKIAVTASVAGPYLLVIADTAFPLLTTDYAADGTGDILANLRAGNTASGYDLRAALAYFVVN